MDVEVDLLLTDPPYARRVHAGGRTGSDHRRTGIHKYGHLKRGEPRRLAEAFAPRTRRWAVIWTDHISFHEHEVAWQAQGWRTFAPVMWVKTHGAMPRQAGDGPASSCEYLLVARPPRAVRNPGSRPGHYLVRATRSVGDGIVFGAKNVDGVLAVLLDYSSPGDIVCDPYAGSGTTAVACVRTGREFVGAEVDRSVHAAAAGRIELVTAPLPGMLPDPFPVRPKQLRLPRPPTAAPAVGA